MTPHEIERLHSQIGRIKRLDDMLDRLARNPEDSLDKLGEVVINVLGRNFIDKRADWVGEVTLVAVFNALRAEREALREGLKGRVDIPETPHRIQVLQEQP